MGAESMIPGGFLFPLISGIATGLAGAWDKNKAKYREKALGERPMYNIPEPTLRNQLLAENMAQQGLSDASMMQGQQSNDRALDNGIDALLRAGGGINSISDLYSRYGENSTQLAVLDDQARFRNQQLLMGQNSQLADELDKKWQLNTFDPWKDEKQAIADLRTLGESKQAAGASMIANSMGGGNHFQFKTKETPTQQPMYNPQGDGNNNSMDAYRGNYDSGYSPSFVMQDNGANNGYNNQPRGNYILDNIYSGNKWDGSGY